MNDLLILPQLEAIMKELEDLKKDKNDNTNPMTPEWNEMLGNTFNNFMKENLMPEIRRMTNTVILPQLDAILYELEKSRSEGLAEGKTMTPEMKEMLGTTVNQNLMPEIR